MSTSNGELRQIFQTGWRSFTYAFRFSPVMYGGIIVMDIILAVVGYVQIGAMGYIIDTLISILNHQADTGKLMLYIGIYTGSLVLPMIINKVYNLIIALFFRRFSDHAAMEFVRSVATRDIQIIEDSEYQNRRAKAREQGVWQVYHSAEKFGLIFAKIVSIVIAITYLGTLNWRFAVLGIIAAIPALLVEYVHGQRVYGAWDEDTIDRRMNETQRDQLHTKKDLIELRLFTNVQHFLDLVWNYMYSFQQKMLSKERQRIVDELYGVLINGGAFVGALYLITDQVLAGIITIGGLTVALGAYSKLEADLGRLFYQFGSFSKAARYARELFAVMDTQNVLPQPTECISIDYSQPPTIEFRDVWFRYPGSDAWVFQGLNLVLRSGSRTALVGHNGAGKTTFVHLLLRIYDPTQGQVLINGVDIRDIDLDDYYLHTAALMQEFAMFKFVTKQAIALGNTGIPYDHERMLRAARASHAYSFIEQWENGYDEMIGREFDGKELSGGERQRMAIARVFYRDAGLIILDEPTSAVDAIAEQEIFESIYNSDTAKTVLTISHRFSTVKKSDTIIVLEHGTVVEQGSHSELLARAGRYAELYTAQASAYQD